MPSRPCWFAGWPATGSGPGARASGSPRRRRLAPRLRRLRHPVLLTAEPVEPCRAARFGSPSSGLRLNPERARAAAGSGYFAVGRLHLRVLRRPLAPCVLAAEHGRGVPPGGAGQVAGVLECGVILAHRRLGDGTVEVVIELFEQGRSEERR